MDGQEDDESSELRVTGKGTSFDLLRMDGYTTEVLIPSKRNNNRRTADPTAQHENLTGEQRMSLVQKMNNTLIYSKQPAEEAKVAARTAQRVKKEAKVKASIDDMIGTIEEMWMGKLSDVLNDKYWPRECEID